MLLEFAERSSRISIDTAKCGACRSRACVDACNKFARGMLRIDDRGLPSVGANAEDALRLGTECLACEYACRLHGNNAIRIDVPIAGLDEYMRKRS